MRPVGSIGIQQHILGYKLLRERMDWLVGWSYIMYIIYLDRAFWTKGFGFFDVGTLSRPKLNPQNSFRAPPAVRARVTSYKTAESRYRVLPARV
jgi:hypothetical protein